MTIHNVAPQCHRFPYLQHGVLGTQTAQHEVEEKSLAKQTNLQPPLACLVFCRAHQSPRVK